jgi:hypothetical protein
MIRPPRTLENLRVCPLSLNHFYRFTLAFAGFFLTASAWALQISQPLLMSRLGEPLKLQFIVNEVSEAERQLLTISVAEPKGL